MTDRHADHKKNWSSALLDPPSVRRSNNDLERCMWTIKKEVSKKKALSSYNFLDELAEHMQDKSEDFVDGKHVDDMLNCATDMDAHCKTLIRKMRNKSFEEDFQAKELTTKL